MVIDIGIPHIRNPATPMIVQLDLNPEAVPNASRTLALRGNWSPSSRIRSMPGLASFAKPEK
jgi:hypothetical protein